MFNLLLIWLFLVLLQHDQFIYFPNLVIYLRITVTILTWKNIYCICNVSTSYTVVYKKNYQ